MRVRGGNELRPGSSAPSSQSRLTAAAGAIDCLKSLGVDTVFGIPGVHNQSFYDALIDAPDLRSVVTRHEQGAAFMADGYARASGKVGACFLITGPGLTNAATAIAEAYSDSVPMICVTTCYESDPRTAGRRLHDLRSQALVIQGLFKHSLRVSAASRLPGSIRLAHRIAREGRPGPVSVEVPIEILDLEIDPATALAPQAAEAPVETLAASAAAGVRSGRGLHPGVFEGQRPVIVVGGGCVASGGAVTELAERLGAVVICTAAGKGVVPDDHPLALGAWLKTAVARQLVAGADPLILLGTEWSTTDLGEAPYRLPPRVVRVDADPVPHPHVGLTIEADVADVIDAWLDESAEVRGDRPWPDVSSLRDRARAEPRRWTESAVPYVDALRASLDRDAVVVNDMNTLSYAAVERFDSYLPRRFLFPRGYGTLGYALPAAIGAKLAVPDTQVVAIAGDGGFLFTAEELATAVRLEQSLPIVIWNNDSFGAIRATRTAAYGRSADDALTNPDFVAFAEAFGAAGVRVASAGALRAAIAEASTREGPTVIDVVAG